MGCRLTCPCRRKQQDADVDWSPPTPSALQAPQPDFQLPHFQLPKVALVPSVRPRDKNYSPDDPTLTFVDYDDHDFLEDNHSSRRAQMSCGHSVTPQSLTAWCERQLNEGKSSFHCGCCNVEWTYEEVCKMAVLTENERSTFEKQMFRNVAFKDMNAKTCPGCRSLVVRTELRNLCVECPQCSQDQARDFCFCWQCLNEWKGPAPRGDHCDNKGCTNQALVTLRTCPAMKFVDVRGVSGCPSVRACPTCGLLVEHNSHNCKNVVCADCKVEFCFVCLKLTVECLKTSDYFISCSGGVAPRQTSIRYRNVQAYGNMQTSIRYRNVQDYRNVQAYGNMQTSVYFISCSGGVVLRQTSIRYGNAVQSRTGERNSI